METRGLLVLGCCALFLASVCNAALCGHHAKPMEGPTEEKADLTPEKFWNEYVRKAEPVIIRGAVAQDQGLKLWDDEYVLKKYGNLKVRMEAKDEGGRRMEQMPSVDSMSNFYSKWMKGGYTVTQLPGAMNNESSVPTCMACGPIRDQLLEANLWISTGDTNSKIHKDSNNQMNCLYKGTKDWSLFAPEHAKSLYLVNERPGLDQMYDTAGFSRINTRNVDLKQYPKFANVPFMRVRVNPGDCLFVPGTYIHHVYSSGERNMQVSLLFSGPEIPTAMQRVHGKKLGGPEFSKANDFGAKCSADHKQHSVQIGHVDVAWAYDGVGPITMGFSNPHSYIAEWKQSVKRIQQMKGSVKKEDFVKLFVRFIDQMDPCSDSTARFSDDTEMRRHVLEALDVLKPEVSGKHDHWNATCTNGMCQVPMLCTIIKDAVKNQASSLFDKLAKDGILDPAVFAKQPRRFLQDAMVGTFVRDQVAAVFEEVTGDYEGASGTSASFEQDGQDDGQDDRDGRDDL